MERYFIMKKLMGKDFIQIGTNLIGTYNSSRLDRFTPAAGIFAK